MFATASAGASPWIYGIHWYGDGNSNDVEEMTGGKPVWVLETVMVYTAGWRIEDQIEKLRAVQNKGHTLVIRIEPEWGMTIPAPVDREQYLVDLKAVVEQASDVCNIWQIGNEMNLYAEYGGHVLSASDYISYYKQVRQTIKEVESPLGEQTVLVGPVSPGAYFNEVRHTDGGVYLREMCQGLGPGDTDGFALHSYGAPWFNAEGAVTDFMNGVSSQLHIIDENGHCDKPAFILEWNRQTNPPGDPNQEAETARFLMDAYRALGQWNANPDNHPVVCAAWFIYPDFGGWENFSILNLHGLNERGAGNDLWDSFQQVASEDIPAGPMEINCSDPTPAPTPASGLQISRGTVDALGDLPYQPSDSDGLHGNVATRLTGGFYQAVVNDSDREPALTDGASLGPMTGLLQDFPGVGQPAWSGYWTLANGSPVDLSELRVLSGNLGREGRIFHHYDAYTTGDPSPGSASAWELIGSEITSATFGTRNSTNLTASWTRVTGEGGGPIAQGVTGLRLDFYAVSNTDSLFVDDWDAGSPGDTDGQPAAIESPLIFEIDAWFQGEGAPVPTPTPSPTPHPGANLIKNGSFEDGFQANGVGNHWNSWQGDWSNSITFLDETSLVHDGAHSQGWAVSGTDRFHGGVYQQVEVEPTERYTLSAWMRREGQASGQWMEFGYDTGGGTAAEAASVVYTKLEDQGPGQWVQYLEEVVAAGPVLTVFAKAGHYQQDGSGNAFYLDQVFLRQTDQLSGTNVFQVY